MQNKKSASLTRVQNITSVHLRFSLAPFYPHPSCCIFSTHCANNFYFYFQVRTDRRCRAILEVQETGGGTIFDEYGKTTIYFFWSLSLYTGLCLFKNSSSRCYPIPRTVPPTCLPSPGECVIYPSAYDMLPNPTAFVKTSGPKGCWRGPAVDGSRGNRSGPTNSAGMGKFGWETRGLVVKTEKLINKNEKLLGGLNIY